MKNRTTLGSFASIGSLVSSSFSALGKQFRKRTGGIMRFGTWAKHPLMIGAALLAVLTPPLPSYAAASPDGRVYNVTATLGANIRSCAGTGCSILTTVSYGKDLLNDASGGSTVVNGITWVRVTYSFSSSDLCTNGTESKGWVDASLLSAGQPQVAVTSGANIRSSSSCSSSSYTTVPNGTNLTFYSSTNQWSQKWYEVVRPGGPLGSTGWVQGWQLTDVH